MGVKMVVFWCRGYVGGWMGVGRWYYRVVCKRSLFVWLFGENRGSVRDICFVLLKLWVVVYEGSYLNVN